MRINFKNHLIKIQTIGMVVFMVQQPNIMEIFGLV